MGLDHRNPDLDRRFAEEEGWGREFARLREIILSWPLTETLKWGQPCYGLDGKNVVLIHGFKGYCALLFMKGALLSDPHGLLVRQTANVQSGRQIRFSNLGDIERRAEAILETIGEAIEIERSGLTVQRKSTAEFPVPEEFQRMLETMPALQTAFAALTPGRQRAYLLYFANAKRTTTRSARIENYRQKILDGKGLDD